MRAAGGKLRQDQLRVVLQEQHGGDHDIGIGDGIVAMRQRHLTARPFIGGMNGEFQPGYVAPQHVGGLARSHPQMAVHRDQHDFHGRGWLSAHNGPLRRTAFRP